MKRNPLLMGVVALAVWGCKGSSEEVAAGEAYGCVNLFDGKEMSCTELDGSTTEQERQSTAEACVHQTMKHLGGRVVRHCPTDGVAARCVLPGGKAVIRYYQASTSEQEMRGHRIGCKARGGAFEEGG